MQREGRRTLFPWRAIDGNCINDATHAESINATRPKSLFAHHDGRQRTCCSCQWVTRALAAIAADIGRHRQTMTALWCLMSLTQWHERCILIIPWRTLRQTSADYDCTVVSDAGKTCDVT